MPREAKFVINTLKKHGHESFIVGGCIRDALLGITPHDWDLCTSATPEEMLDIFHQCMYVDAEKQEGYDVENIITTGIDYGTVTLVINGEPYEITTFRKEQGYSDGRHPDHIEYAKTIEEDLSRRDFTCNAMAYNDEVGLVDPYEAYWHIKGNMLIPVGMAYERFEEDALRIMRALRFASRYHWDIETGASISMHKLKHKLQNVSKERISTEFCKILKEDCADILAFYPDIVKEIIPEMGECVGFLQRNPYHQHDVYTHILETIRNCPSNDMITRLALFFHDIGKPRCAVVDEKDPNRLHFYGHGEVSAEMTNEILRRMKFDNATREAVVELVRHHDAEFTVSERFVRKWLHKIGPEQFERLMDIRESDIKGQRKEFYTERLQKVQDLRALYTTMMEQEQCFSLKDLAVNGKDLITAGYKPGPVIGEILDTLLQKVMDGELENDVDTLMWYAVNAPVEEKTEDQEHEL